MSCRTLLLLIALTRLCAAAVGTTEQTWQHQISDGIIAANKDLAKSEQFFLAATRTAEAFGPNDPRLGTSFNSLGLVLKAELRFADAERAFMKALGILEKAYGPESLDVGNVCFNIASVIVAGGHEEAALPYIQRSRTIYLSRLGSVSPKTATASCMLGIAYRVTGKFVDAEGPLKQCADIRESNGGVDNPELAEAMYNLGLVYQHQGKFALADSRLKLAVKIREITLGVDSPAFAEALEAHASLLKTMGRDQDSAREQAMAAAVRRIGKKTK